MQENINADMRILRTMVKSAYDLQMLRMQVGLRLCANFRYKLGLNEPAETEEAEAVEAEANSLLKKLKESYSRLTDGVARNRTLPAEKGFTGDELISTYTELVLVNQYVKIESDELSQFRQLELVLDKLPIYTEYLKRVPGVGPAMASVLLTYFDPYKADYISKFWAYAGLDVAPDGAGRSRRAEHLIDREYTTKEGVVATKKSVTYQPWLKSRLLGALGTSFMRTANCPWRAVYDGRKHRILTDPNRKKVTLAEYKRAHKAGEDTKQMWPPLRIHRDAIRVMVKDFLAEFWVEWRTKEGLPLTPTYHEAKHGHIHHAKAS